MSDGYVPLAVALAQVDGKWPNLALAKLAAWHRREGDVVDLFNPMVPTDRTYASKTFVDTPDNLYLPEGTVRGGSGYDLTTTLSAEVERMKPDWSLWPWFKDDLGYTTRGCPRRCSFCIVPEKEGKLRIVADFGDVWTGRSVLHLIDANLTAAPLDHFRRVCADATKARCRLDFSQGLDARLLTDEHAEVVSRTLVDGCIHLAFDHLRDERAVRNAIDTFKRAGVIPSRLMFYVLIGYDSTPEEDMERIEILRSMGTNPFVMKYRRSDPYQTRLARWVNNVVAFKSMSWDEWQTRFKTKVAV